MGRGRGRKGGDQLEILVVFGGGGSFSLLMLC